MVYSVSCTTRAPRGDEKNGVAYHFLTPEQFEVHVEADAFLEHATVHGNRYGTLKTTVRTAMQAGESVLLDIDVQGAQQVRTSLTSLPEDDPIVRGFVDVFVKPPSMAVLRSRLEGRGEDAAEIIERRLKNASAEMACADAYCYVVVNDDLEKAVRAMCDLLGKEASR